jgi:hypothetical protein
MMTLDNLTPDHALRWKAEDRRLGRSGIVMRKAGKSNVVAPIYVSYVGDVPKRQS